MTKEYKTNLGLVKWCKKYLGHPYWYGTFGQVSTKTLLKQKAKQYPNHYKSSRMPKYYSQIGTRVFDCVGLIKGYIWENNGKISYNPKQDKSADGMFAACKERGSIKTIPDIPGILVFMPGHVGVYIGNGEVIEARGFAYGVVKTKLANRGWKNWGKCPYINYVKKEKKKEVRKMSIKKWQKDMGAKALDNLSKRKINGEQIVNNPENWEKTLGENTPQWLFWSIIDRITKNK